MAIEIMAAVGRDEPIAGAADDLPPPTRQGPPTDLAGPGA